MLFSVGISIHPKVSTKVGFDHSERLAQQISWGIGEPDKDETEKLGAIQGSHVGLSNVFCFQCSREECSLTICFDVCPLLMQAFSCHKTHTMDLSQADQYSPEPSRLSIFKSLVLSEGWGCYPHGRRVNLETLVEGGKSCCENSMIVKWSLSVYKLSPCVIIIIVTLCDLHHYFHLVWSSSLSPCVIMSLGCLVKLSATLRAGSLLKPITTPWQLSPTSRLGRRCWFHFCKRFLSCDYRLLMFT